MRGPSAPPSTALSQSEFESDHSRRLRIERSPLAVISAKERMSAASSIQRSSSPGDKEALCPDRSDHAEGAQSLHDGVPRAGESDDEEFFLNIYGEPLKYEVMKAMFDQLRKRSDISHLHPHLLRHTAATRMLANGADLHSVQRLLRHPDLRTTLRYLHLVHEQLQEKMQLFSPLSRITERRTRAVPPELRRVK